MGSVAQNEFLKKADHLVDWSDPLEILCNPVVEVSTLPIETFY